jgi:hypothetical protein
MADELTTLRASREPAWLRTKRSRRTAVGAIVTLLVLGLAASARAAETHVFHASFAAKGAGAGQLQLAEHSGLAIDTSTHNVYVADTGNRRVDEFEANGTFVRAFGAGVGPLGEDICTTLSTCKAGTSGSTPGEFVAPSFIAVDNTPGPSAGDVYVGDPGDNIVTKFTGEGTLIESWGESGQLNGSTSNSGPFTEMAGIAVDSLGVLDVLTNEPTERIFQFAQEGSFEDEIETPAGQGNEPRGLAVNAIGEFFKANVFPAIQELTRSGKLVGFLSNSATVDPINFATDTNNLYVGEPSQVRQYVFTSPGVVSEPGGTCVVTENENACEPTFTFGAGSLSAASGVAVDKSSGDVYVADASDGKVGVFVQATPHVVTGAASGVGPTSATVHGLVNPNGAVTASCTFEYVEAGEYHATNEDPYAGGGSTPCAASPGSGTNPVPVTADLAGLAPGVVYHYRLAAGNAAGVSFGEDQSLTTLPRPSLEGETSSNLTKTSSSLTSITVDLSATVNPNGYDTHYRFEYGTSVTYGASIPEPEGDIGAGTSGVAVSQQLSGLEAERTYHWRIVATSANGTTASPDHTFIYKVASGGLPDGRAYEQVTPTAKNGALISDYTFAPPPEISDAGSRLIVGTTQCFANAGSCVGVRQTTGTPYEFTRNPSGWLATQLAPPASEFRLNTYWADGTNINTGETIFSAPTPPAENDYFYREAKGGLTDIGPLSPPSHAGLSAVSGTRELQVSADFSHVAFAQSASNGWLPEEDGVQAFEYTQSGSTHPVVVGVTGAKDSTEESTNLISAGCPLGAKLGYEPGQGSQSSVSESGDVVFFTADACPSGAGTNAGVNVPVEELYARVDGGSARARTVALSEPQAPQTAAEPEGNELQENCTSLECKANTSPANESSDWRPARFQGASSNGTKVVFTSSQQLTDGASEETSECAETTGAANGCNLYLFDFEAPRGHRLIDLSEGAQGPGGPRVQGVMGISDDGSHVYFLADNVLTAAPNSDGVIAHAGKDNLYVYVHESGATGGHVAFIATLPDDHALRDELVNLQANVTPDGRFLVFTSDGDLTPDETGGSGSQVFRYDAGTARLRRVSIGERGFNDDGNAGVGEPFIVEGFGGYARAGAGRPDPTMSNDGARVFFGSPRALTVKALNDVLIGHRGEQPEYAQNVYEWEQAGVGSCPAGQAEGCVYLLSDGKDTSNQNGETCFGFYSTTCLLGSDESGSNVFFTTADRLVTGDTDTELDVYDARICSTGEPCISSPPAPAPPCSGEECHGAAAVPPASVSAGTVSLNGAGNLAPPPAVRPKPLTRAEQLARALKACKKVKSRRKRAACQAAAHKRYGPKKPAKATKRGRSR